MFLYVFFMVLFLQVLHCQDLGDICHNEVSNATGTCKIINDCQSAIDDVNNGITPQLCGFEGSVPIVCCVDNAPSYTTTTDKSTATTPTPTAGVRSLQKCEEYSFVNTSNKCDIYRTLNLTRGSGLIIEGEPAKEKEFPHMALIGFNNGNEMAWDCGGSLISENYVLTAVHCLYSRNYGEPTMIRLGDLNLTDPNDDGNVQQIGIKELIAHPGYNISSKLNDIALILLEIPAQLGFFVRPACLYTKREINRKFAIATGWGFTEEGGNKSEWLMKVALQLFPDNRCKISYPKLDSATQLCAGSNDSEKDVCQGDSGGPLQIYSNKYCMYDIIGVTAYGQGCGNAGIPSVFTKVYPYLQWIEDIVWPSIN